MGLDRLRIALVAPLISKSASGLSSYVADLVPRLCEAGHDVTVIGADCGYAGTACGELPEFDRRVCFKMFTVRGRWNRRMYRSSELVDWLKTSVSKFDVLDIQGVWTWIAAEAANACLETGIPYVLTPHGMMTRNDWEKRPLIKRIFFVTKFQQAWRNAAMVRYLSQGELRNSLVMPVTPHVVVPNAIESPTNCDISVAKAKARQHFELPVDSNPLLFLGRVSPEKGVLELLRAFDRVEITCPQSQLLIAGPLQGEYGQQVRAYVANRGNKRVKLLGPVFGELKYGLFAAASAFVMLSKSEGMSIAALEALSLGLPVVLTRESNLPEAEAGNAGVTTQRDPAIAGKDIALLLADPSRLTEMRRNARIVAERHFSWRVILPSLLELYETAVAHRAS